MRIPTLLDAVSVVARCGECGDKMRICQRLDALLSMVRYVSVGSVMRICQRLNTMITVCCNVRRYFNKGFFVLSIVAKYLG